jgi:hypothetical protein
VDQTQLLEQSNTKVFANGDSVEALAYDQRNCRLATTSHYGLIRVYTIENNGQFHNRSLDLD